MRLLRTDTFEKTVEIIQFGDHDTPRYAILSHVWDKEEVTFQDMVGPSATQKPGYEKVRMACSVAAADGYKYVWIDTCCIDKTSSAELSEAINSMYHWYQEADECYAYLADVPSKAEFSGSKWFTRGWTLQELIAPSTVIFLDEKWKRLGTKATLQQDVFDCTKIPVSILSGDDDLENFSIAQRMSWAAERKTTRIEDHAYCLLGIFGINMPLIYGERETAFIRLQEEIMRISDDHSLFAWKSPNNGGGLLATSPDAFRDSGNIVQFRPFDTLNSPLTVSSRGIHLELRFMGVGRPGLGLVILHCKERGEEDKPIAIYVKDLFLTMEQFERARSGELERFDLNKFRLSHYPIRRICIRKGRMTRMRKSKGLEKCDSIALEKIYPDSMLINLIPNPEEDRPLSPDSEEDRPFSPDPEEIALLPAAERGNEDFVWLLLTRSDVEAALKDDGPKALLLAVKGGHEAVVKILVARSDVQVDLKDKDGRTPLSWAAQIGHNAIVKSLLRSGKVDVSSEDKINFTPLLYAVHKGHKAIVRLLLEKGADTEPKGTIHYNSKTPLLYAAWCGNEAIVRLLLEKGAYIEAKSIKNSRTPLSCTAEYGYEAIVRLLLEKGADTEAKDKYRRTPLSYAAENGHKAIVQLLLDSGANTKTKDKYGRTPLRYASENEGEAAMALLRPWNRISTAAVI
jgi:ankyrin repeat protein